jgi:hypothetical protein
VNVPSPHHDEAAAGRGNVHLHGRHQPTEKYGFPDIGSKQPKRDKQRKNVRQTPIVSGGACSYDSAKPQRIGPVSQLDEGR